MCKYTFRAPALLSTQLPRLIIEFMRIEYKQQKSNLMLFFIFVSEAFVSQITNLRREQWLMFLK
ncbi:hypothetical protein ND16A_0566 [Thalassotalea sp. ND16A]|nr:hypothetical protein ND16A_0566 [Thalassotalea sp. ND16A]